MGRDGWHCLFVGLPFLRTELQWQLCLRASATAQTCTAPSRQDHRGEGQQEFLSPEIHSLTFAPTEAEGSVEHWSGLLRTQGKYQHRERRFTYWESPSAVLCPQQEYSLRG